MAFDPAAATAAYIDSLGPDALAKAAAYTSGNNWITVAGVFVSLLATFLLVRSRLLDRLSARLNGGKLRPNLSAFLVGGATLLGLALITLPWDLWTGYFRERSFGRTGQPLGDYLGQAALSLGLTLVMGGLFLVALYALIRKAPRTWWLWAGGLVAATAAFLLLAAPVVIEPLFNDFKPLPAGPVRDAIVEQAKRAGVPPERIFVYDGSRQSNNFTANAGGLGGSARIAISDVAYRGASLDEVKAVTGHEIGHYVLGHSWRSAALLSGLAVLLFFLTDRLYARFARFFGSAATITDPVGLPVLLFLGGLLGFFATPLVNANTRSGESAADRYSLETVNLPDALSSALVKTAEYRYPRPTPLAEALFYTHPSVEKRVRAAMDWKAAHPANAPSGAD